MADEQTIGADDVARKHFATTFRGFDQHEVRAFLAQIAAELASLHEREKALRERLAAAEEAPVSRPVDEEELESALGVEMTRVLHAAREAAAEIRARAEESVARLLREANGDAVRMRSEAESVLATRTEEAEAAAAVIVAAAEEDAGALRADAQAAATSAVEEAQQQGRDMVGEAQAVRERVLKDLARRRRAAITQLDQLLAGRERLLGAYEVVRATLDEATSELAGAEAEARGAAEAAGTRSQPDDTTPAEDTPAAVAAPPDDEPAPSPPDAPPERAPEPEPAPEAVAEAVAEQADDRRSSALRLLRRTPEASELPPLDDAVEGVRIIRPEPSAEAPVPRPVAVPHRPAAPAPEPEPEPEPEPAAAEPEPDDADTPVDDLFARLRADREAAVARAEEVLADDDAGDTTGDAGQTAEEEAAAGAVDMVFEARDAAVEPVERALTRAMKRALADEQNEVLDALRRLRGAPRLDVLLPAADEHAARFAAAAANHLAAGAAAGAGDEAPPAVGALAAELGAEISGDLRARLERALDATSGDEEALVETISATYREWKSSRAEPFARHHVVAAHASGSFAVTAADHLCWIVDPAEGGCPDCDDNALAGPTPKGHAFPTGQVHPPAHAGCRCLVLPAS